MKKFLYIAALVAFFASCAGAPAPVEEAKPPVAAEKIAEAPAPAPAPPAESAVAAIEPVVGPAAVVEQPKKEPKRITVRIPVERKSSIRFSDGSLDEYSLPEYDDAFILKVQTRYSASGSILEQTRFTVEAGRLVRKATTDGEGKLVSSRNYVYGADGLVSVETLVDGNGKPLSSFEFGYDASGHRISWTVKDPKGSVLAVTSYAYKDGKIRNAELKDGVGRTNGSSAYEYDADGRIAKQSYFDAKGSLLRMEFTRWVAGSIAAEERTNAGGTVQQRTSYEYGADGELLRKTVEDLVGKSKQSVEYEYDFREEIKEVME